MTRYRTLAVFMVVVSALSTQHSALAQEVRWRHDYNAARREARDHGRPLLLDIGAERCFWCQRLDATTFRDPTLTALLNERLVPLKLDGNRETVLVETLGIKAYPTLILAGPDGKIFETVEGYVEAGRLTELVQKLLATGEAPAALLRDYQEAVTAVEAGDYPRAVERLRRVAQDGLDRPVQTKARQLLQQIEELAAGRLAVLKTLADQGQGALAVEALADFTRAFEHTAAAAGGVALAKLLAERPEVKARQRERRAREQILQAREDFRAKRFLACLERCEALAAQFPDLSEGAEAQELAAAIKDHPERLQQVCDALAERLGSMQLLLAESLLKHGRPAEAAGLLEQVLQRLAGSPGADRVRSRLNEVLGLFPREAAESPKADAGPQK